MRRASEKEDDNGLLLVLLYEESQRHLAKQRAEESDDGKHGGMYGLEASCGIGKFALSVGEGYPRQETARTR